MGHSLETRTRENAPLSDKTARKDLVTAEHAASPGITDSRHKNSYIHGRQKSSREGILRLADTIHQHRTEKRRRLTGVVAREAELGHLIRVAGIGLLCVTHAQARVDRQAFRHSPR